MKRVFLVTLLLAMVARGGMAAAAPTLRDAEQLYFQSQVADAETAFIAIRRDAAASPGWPRRLRRPGGIWREFSG